MFIDSFTLCLCFSWVFELYHTRPSYLETLEALNPRQPGHWNSGCTKDEQCVYAQSTIIFITRSFLCALGYQLRFSDSDWEHPFHGCSLDPWQLWDQTVMFDTLKLHSNYSSLILYFQKGSFDLSRKGMFLALWVTPFTKNLTCLSKELLNCSEK